MNFSKIVSLEALCALVDSLKKQGKKIVYAHGAFDLLHAGHIHHLEEAKKLGDILVATVTPDEFIQRGPGRPRFKEEERLRFLASLECVNFVALNDAPDVAETVKKLRPDIYAKGEDVKHKVDDSAGGLYREIAALGEIGGKVHFIKSLPIHSTELLNKYFSVYPKEVNEFLERFSRKYSLEMIAYALERIKKLKVLVIGDAIIDAYQYVSLISKSPKNNHIVAKRLDEEKFAGGIMACANHIAGFCEDVAMVTCLGEQNSYESFIKEHLKGNIKPIFVYRSDGPTTLKRRFVEPTYMTKVFEVYDFHDSDLPVKETLETVECLKNMISNYDLVLVADFGHGFLTDEIINLLCEKAKFLSLNVQTNSANYGFNFVTKYSRADYVCINEPEIRLAMRRRTGELDPLIEQISRETRAERISITGGHRGCMTFRKGEGFCRIPVLSTTVIDTVGAGDAFFSVSAPWAALGLPMELVGFIGNISGAIKVGTVCNKSSVGTEQLKDFIGHLLAGRN